MQDRFVKIMLVVVAALLAANLLHSGRSDNTMPMPAIISGAQAQAVTLPAPAMPIESGKNSQVKTLNGSPVEDLKDVVALGDGRTFVVSNPKGFMVYQVQPR